MPSEGVMLPRIAVDCCVSFAGECRFDFHDPNRKQKTENYMAVRHSAQGATWRSSE
jgi:hypothetical protein